MKDLDAFQDFIIQNQELLCKIVNMVIKVCVKENYYPKGLGSSCYYFLFLLHYNKSSDTWHYCNYVVQIFF